MPPVILSGHWDANIDIFRELGNIILRDITVLQGEKDFILEYIREIVT